MQYVELHTHSNFSFSTVHHKLRHWLSGQQKWTAALALTDHDNLSAAVRFSQATQKLGVRAIYGAELTEDDHHLHCWSKTRSAGATFVLIPKAQHAAPKGEASCLSALSKIILTV